MRPQNDQTHARNLATNVQDFKLVLDYFMDTRDYRDELFSLYQEIY